MMSYQRNELGLGIDTSAYDQFSSSITLWHNNYRATKSTLVELENFFKARAEIEEEFAQRLLRLAQQALGESESRDTILALKAVKEELVETADSHKKLASQIREELQQPTLKQAGEFSKLKRQQVSNFLTKQQTHFNSLAILERAKERCQEANQVGGNEFRSVADTEFHLALARFTDVSYKLKTETNLSAEGFHQLEFNRLQFLRNTVWKYTKLLSGVCATDDESLERVRRTVEKMDVKKEAEAFLSCTPYSKESTQETFSKPAQPNSEELVRTSCSEDKNIYNHSLPSQKPTSLCNEIDNTLDPRFNQPVSSLNTAMVNVSNALEKTCIASIPDRSKNISNEQITATIARSPIFAAKRTSTNSRPSPKVIPQQPTPPVVVPVVDQTLVTPQDSKQTEPLYEQKNTSRNSVQSTITQPVCEYPPDLNYQRPRSGSNQNPPSQNYSPYSSPSNSIHAPHSYRHASIPPQGYTEKKLDSNVNATSSFAEQLKPTVSSSSSQSYPSIPPTGSLDKSKKADSRPILFYVRAVYDYETDNPEEIALREGQIIAVFATQLDGWWEGQVLNTGTVKIGIFPSNFTEPVSL